MKMNLAAAEEAIELAKEKGCVEMPGFNGIYLDSAENIQADQKEWDDEDSAKEIDFSVAPYWLTTDDGAYPVSIHDAQDLLAALT